MSKELIKLTINGVEVEETEDGFTVQGCGGPPQGGETGRRAVRSRVIVAGWSGARLGIWDCGLRIGIRRYYAFRNPKSTFGKSRLLY